MTSPRLLLRRLVLATSVPPLLQLYRAGYAAVIRLAVRLFRRYPAVKAVYLRRGSACGEILPLVSDIDFALIGEPMSPDSLAELHREYARLARATTLLDRTLEVYDEESFRRQYATNYYCQYRFTEGKQSWKLLYGRDYLAELPDLAPEGRWGGFFAEIQVWWALFAWRLLQGRKYEDEPVTRNNVCFKAVAEVLKVTRALNGSPLTHDRREALAAARPQLDAGGRALVEALQAGARKRFRVRDESVVEATKEFLLCHLDGFYAGFRDHPQARALSDCGQRIDCPRGEWAWGEAARAHVKRLSDHARQRWPGSWRATYVVPSAHFNLDELLVMLEVDPQRLPSVGELRAINRLHRQTAGQAEGRVRLFLLLPSAAFQIDADDLTKSWQTLLCPPSTPEVFELLGGPRFALTGGGYLPPGGPAWTPLVEHFCLEEERLFHELLEDPSVYKLGAYDFLRVFWKTAQLAVLNRSAARGEVLYALTPDAIGRALRAAGVPLPPRLAELAAAYRGALEGEAPEVARLVPEAVAYLKGIRRRPRRPAAVQEARP